MPEKTYKIIEVVGVSEDSIQQAVRNALSRTRKTVHNVGWFEVTSIRGTVSSAGEPQFEVEVRIGFRLAGNEALLNPYVESV